MHHLKAGVALYLSFFALVAPKSAVRRRHEAPPKNKLNQIVRGLPTEVNKRDDTSTNNFQDLRLAILHADGAEIESQACMGHVIPVMRFLLEYFIVAPIHRRRIEEVWKKLVPYERWADGFVEVLSSREDDPLPQETKQLLKLEDLLAGVNLRREERLEAQEKEASLCTIEAIPSHGTFTKAVDKLLAMNDVARYENEAEITFQDLKRAVLHTQADEDMILLLDQVAADVPAATWDFLLRFGARRRIYHRQVAEVVPKLLLSKRWKDALEALPGLQGKIAKLPEKARHGFPMIEKRLVLQKAPAQLYSGGCCCIEQGNGAAPLGVRVGLHIMVGPLAMSFGGCPRVFISGNITGGGHGCGCTKLASGGSMFRLDFSWRYSQIVSPWKAPDMCSSGTSTATTSGTCTCGEDASIISHECTQNMVSE